MSRAGAPPIEDCAASGIDPSLERFPSLLHAFRAAVREQPGALALVCGERRLSYAELGQAVDGLAAALGSFGVAGRRVALALPSSIEAVVGVLAVWAARAQVAPINPFFTAPELRVVLAEAEPCLVICGFDALEKLRPLCAALGIERLWHWGSPAQVGAAQADALELGAWLGCEAPARFAGPLPEAAEPALLIFTGGTTGEPKAVEHSHASLMVSVLLHCSVWPVLSGKERFLSVAPIFHIWGLAYATLVPLYARGTLVIVPRYQPEEVLRALEREQVTVFGGGPAPIYMGLSQSPAFSSTDFSSLKYCLSGGSPVPEELHRTWQSGTGCSLLEGWGMSEAAPLCLNRPAGTRKLLSVGRAVPGTEVQIVDLETGRQVLATGEAGEVRVRGPQLMLGYRGRPEATREVLRDGWLYTGDIGYLDADAHLFLVDRKKDMIIVGGYNVYPRQVDEVLFGHPSIAEAATVGCADARLGEALVAFVVLRRGQQLNEVEFFEYCRANLVKYRRPVAVHFVAALPRTNARKIDKKALRA
ncbi:MAG TPA: AMP-binding protein, partial [Polyangiaceae bacterium]|nr:AMP-binding protein [Polyangiaceae bacterium]